MPLFLVVDAAEAHEAARELVRKTLKRIVRHCPGEQVALLGKAADGLDLDAVKEEAGDGVDVGQGTMGVVEGIRRNDEEASHLLRRLGSGGEHLTQL